MRAYNDRFSAERVAGQLAFGNKHSCISKFACACRSKSAVISMAPFKKFKSVCSFREHQVDAVAGSKKDAKNRSAKKMYNVVMQPSPS